MIRPFTFLCMAVFAGSGLYLYQAKHVAELETREIRRLRTEAEVTRQRAAVLVTDYQLENDPQRLSDFAAKFAPQLKQTQPTQFTILADLERRLPPVGLPAPVPAAPASDDLAYNYPPVPRALLADAGSGEAPDAPRPAAAIAVAKPVAVSDARPAAPRPAARTVAARETTPTRDLNKAYVPPGDALAAASGQGIPARPASSYASGPPYGSAAYSQPGYAAADQGSMLGSQGRGPGAQPRPFTPAYAPVMASQQRPYYAPQYGASPYATQSQYAPPYRPQGTGGSALGMARPMAAPAYQGAASQYNAVGNGG